MKDASNVNYLVRLFQPNHQVGVGLQMEIERYQTVQLYHHQSVLFLLYIGADTDTP